MAGDRPAIALDRRRRGLPVPRLVPRHEMRGGRRVPGRRSRVRNRARLAERPAEPQSAHCEVERRWPWQEPSRIARATSTDVLVSQTFVMNNPSRSLLNRQHRQRVLVCVWGGGGRLHTAASPRLRVTLCCCCRVAAGTITPLIEPIELLLPPERPKPAGGVSMLRFEQVTPPGPRKMI